MHNIFNLDFIKFIISILLYQRINNIIKSKQSLEK